MKQFSGFCTGVVSLLLLLSSCGGSTHSRPVADSRADTTTTTVGLRSETVAPGEWWRTDRTVAQISDDDINSIGIVEYNRVSLDLLWHASEHVIRGEVTAIEGPFWNQASGQFWSRPDDRGPLPIPYREVTVRVSETFRGRFSPGEETVIHAIGAGPGVSGWAPLRRCRVQCWRRRRPRSDAVSIPDARGRD